jgi:hypothetical protein
MSWAKICDTLHSHPKAMAAELESMGLWALTLSHCAAYLSDGHVTRAAATRIAGPDRIDRLSARLVSSGLWEPHPSGDGWQVHDYLEFNPPRSHVIAEREAKRQGGRDGAARRWHRDGSTHRSTHSSSHGGSHASAIGIGDAPDPVPIPVPIPVPSPIPNTKEREREETLPPSDFQSTGESENTDSAQVIHDAWCEAREKKARDGIKPMLDASKRASVTAALALGYSSADLREAVQGFTMQSDKDRATSMRGFGWCLESSSNVDAARATLAADRAERERWRKCEVPRLQREPSAAERAASKKAAEEGYAKMMAELGKGGTQDVEKSAA